MTFLSSQLWLGHAQRKTFIQARIWFFSRLTLRLIDSFQLCSSEFENCKDWDDIDLQALKDEFVFSFYMSLRDFSVFYNQFFQLRIQSRSDYRRISSLLVNSLTSDSQAHARSACSLSNMPGHIHTVATQANHIDVPRMTKVAPSNTTNPSHGFSKVQKNPMAIIRDISEYQYTVQLSCNAPARS